MKSKRKKGVKKMGNNSYPTYQCNSACKLGRHIFFPGERAEKVSECEDGFGSEQVKLRLEDDTEVAGSKKIFSKYFIWLKK